MLALLVVISLALLTDYFGESPTSPLHSVQRGIATVLTPLQSGASTVLSPFRDAANYIGSTFKAKSELASAQRKYNELVQQYAKIQYEGILYRQEKSLVKLDDKFGAANYGPVAANVIGADPVLWYDTITVDEGSNAGIRRWDPVVGPTGLVGDVYRVNSNSSIVALITSPDFAVGASVENDEGAPGLIQPKVGDPGVLTLSDLPTNSNISTGQLVVTNGFKDQNAPRIESLAPMGIPIGTVSGTNPQSSLLENQQEQVTPLADLQHLTIVQILTKPHN